MHELGIVEHVIKQVEMIAEKNNVDKVADVKLEFGEVSWIVPEYLKDCWDWMVHKDHPVLENAKFEWEITPAVTYCEDCDKAYETIKYGKICPYCGSGNTYLLEGNDMRIKEITVFDESS